MEKIIISDESYKILKMIASCSPISEETFRSFNHEFTDPLRYYNLVDCKFTYEEHEEYRLIASAEYSISDLGKCYLSDRHRKEEYTTYIKKISEAAKRKAELAEAAAAKAEKDSKIARKDAIFSKCTSVISIIVSIIAIIVTIAIAA